MDKRVIIMIFLLGIMADGTFAQEKNVPQPPAEVLSGFHDTDKNGINDFFADANGDGVNDVSNAVYAHHFDFQDQNNDGRNDLWQDIDGDGVNDLFVKLLKEQGHEPRQMWRDRNGDGILDANAPLKFTVELSQFVIDENQDGKNDITGHDIRKHNVWGYRYGKFDEEQQHQVKNYVDKNQDGMHDAYRERYQRQFGKGKPLHDYFVDKDGDGIADGRGLGRLQGRRRRMRKR